MKFKYIQDFDSSFILFSAVGRLLQSKPLLFKTHYINIEPYHPNDDSLLTLSGLAEPEQGPLVTLEVSGFKPETREETLEDYFENEKSGGKADSIRLPIRMEPDKSVAYVEFKDKEGLLTNVMVEQISSWDHTCMYDRQYALSYVDITMQRHYHGCWNECKLAFKMLSKWRHNVHTTCIHMYFVKMKGLVGYSCHWFDLIVKCNIFQTHFNVCKSNITCNVLDKLQNDSRKEQICLMK